MNLNIVKHGFAYQYEKAIPIADEIAVVIKFKTINAPKAESILCLLNKCPIDIEA